MDEFPVGAFACARDLFEARVLQGFQEVTDFLGHRLTCLSREPNGKRNLPWAGWQGAQRPPLTLRAHRHEFGHSRCLFRDEVKTTNQDRDDGRIPGTIDERESLSLLVWG
jgi:hypothetical protein